MEPEPIRQPSRLLGYPHWETQDPDEATMALSEQQRRYRQEVATAKGYRLSSNTAPLESLTVSSIWTPTPQQAWTEADGRYYLLMFWNQGWNDYRFQARQGRVASGEGLLSTPHRDSYWKSKGNLDVIVVSIPSAMLLREAQNLAGRPLPHPLEATGMLQKRGPIWRLLNRFLRDLESGRFSEPSLLRRERQRQLVTFVAALTPGNIPFREEHAHHIPPLHKLRYDRAMEFMEAHLTDDLSLGDVAAAAGAGARGLERAFAYCRTTWSQEFWAMRMHAARRDLLAPEETVTVSSVARKYGFEPDRFSAQYFRMFQEYPSQTLRLRQLGRQLS